MDGFIASELQRLDDALQLAKARLSEGKIDQAHFDDQLKYVRDQRSLLLDAYKKGFREGYDRAYQQGHEVGLIQAYQLRLGEPEGATEDLFELDDDARASLLADLKQRVQSSTGG